MELRHLRYFVAVAEELNVRRAAGRLRVSQPPVSRQIRDLEEEVGAPLFIRSKQGMQLTDAGHFFLKEARQILAQSRRAVEQAQAASRGEAGRLAFAYDGALFDPAFTRVMREFRKRFPAVELSIAEMHTYMQVPELLDRHIDLAYLGLRFHELEKELEFAWVGRPDILIALPPGHPLARKRVIETSDMAKELLIAPPKVEPGFYELLVNSCRNAGFEPQIVQTGNNALCMLQLVAAGIGIAPVPETFRRLFAIEVEYRPLNLAKSPLDFYIAWRKDNPSPVLAAFIKMIRAQVGQPPES